MAAGDGGAAGAAAPSSDSIEDLLVCTLPDGIVWATEPSNTLFVRTEAKHIWRLVCKQKEGPSIVTGPPGIGKSWTLNYFLIELAKAPVTVVLDLAAARYVLQPDGTVLRYSYGEGTPDDELADKRTWYLFDPDEGNSQPPLKVFAKTVVATSPNHYVAVVEKSPYCRKFHCPALSYRKAPVE